MNNMRVKQTTHIIYYIIPTKRMYTYIQGLTVGCPIDRGHFWVCFSYKRKNFVYRFY